MERLTCSMSVKNNSAALKSYRAEFSILLRRFKILYSDVRQEKRYHDRPVQLKEDYRFLLSWFGVRHDCAYKGSASISVAPPPSLRGDLLLREWFASLCSFPSPASQMRSCNDHHNRYSRRISNLNLSLQIFLCPVFVLAL